jgi:ArsR family transcriptional regulator
MSMRPPSASARSTSHAAAARLFHALSDETRLAVLALLRDGERCVCELQQPLGAAQSRLSFHLKVLRDAGLVTDRRVGRWAYYRITAHAADTAEQAVRQLLAGADTASPLTPERACRPNLPMSPPSSARSTARRPAACLPLRTPHRPPTPEGAAGR